MIGSTVLLGSAAWAGLFHTAVGIDHTLPFVMLSRAQGWSLRRTLLITTAAGVVHVLSSVLVGLVGISLGLTVSSLSMFEATRGELAAWALVIFGLAYAAWSHWRTMQRGTHVHVHADGTVHSHPHPHHPQDTQVIHHHRHPRDAGSVLPRSSVWLLMIFVLGPCEILIPLLMFPAYALDPWLMVAVVTTFGIATIATMVCIVTCGRVAIGRVGFQRLGFAKLSPHVNTLAGLGIAASGASIQIFGI